MCALYFLLLLCVGLVAATAVSNEDSVEQDNRSVLLATNTNCVAQWQSTNPCTNNPLNRLNFPLSGDPSKFIQCGAYTRMFIVQCPNGEVFDQATTSCVKPTVIQAKPVYSLATFGITSNPCTLQNIAGGRIMFGVSSHTAKFVQCTSNGQAQILTCPAQMVWDQSRQSCVFPAGVQLTPGTVGIGAMSLSGLLSTANPCPAGTSVSSQLYYSHPDPTKFIQCDLQGRPFVQQCPSGLLWNQGQVTCAYRATTTTPLYTGIIGNGVNCYLGNGAGVIRGY